MNLEIQYIADKLLNLGFDLKPDDTYAQTDISKLINSKKYTDNEYRCLCGTYMGQSIIGEKCPHCNEEILLRPLLYRYTGWIDLGDHSVISPPYYYLLSRALGKKMLLYIIGDYKSNDSVRYKDDKTGEKTKKKGRRSDKDILTLRKYISKSRQIYEGIGIDNFRKNFKEIIYACGNPNKEETQILLREEENVFTSKIPVYSTAFRPMTETAETEYYTEINKYFAAMLSIALTLPDMMVESAVINALNEIQIKWLQGSDYLTKTEMPKKEGFVRSEIVGGTYNFSARAVVTLGDLSLKADQVDLPYTMLIQLYQYKLTQRYALRYNTTLEMANLQITQHSYDPNVIQLMQELLDEETYIEGRDKPVKGQWIKILREPCNQLESLQLLQIRNFKLHDNTITLPVVVLPGMNCDFDGDQLNLHTVAPELVDWYEPLHYSGMFDYINENIKIDMMKWNYVSMGLLAQC